MARTAGGKDQLEMARAAIRKAKTADGLRAAQAVLLPLELGLSIAQTAVATGRSVGVACTMRTRYSKIARQGMEPPVSKKQLRNRARLPLEEEGAMLDGILERAMQGGVVVVPPLQQKFVEKFGKAVALSTIYRMLARHGWRKLAPDTEHPQGDVGTREDWKKNSPARWQKR
ncbi:helix-turn-helix domain-containing protein [Methyloglobulus sp.]|uniref:helix-turn-helix domain-containing protein n=1 Tax=Methyloglobulus sp. TaxID=2518622 RepID=UPI003988EA3A